MCATLEKNKIRCWIAPRDVIPGVFYAEAIINALNQSKVMVIVFSSNSNKSPQVMMEVERAVNKGIAIIPFRIEDVVPSNAMEYFLSAPHWLDALTPPLEKHLQQLSDTIKALLSRIGKPGVEEAEEEYLEKSNVIPSIGTPINFPDSNLYSAIREALNKKQGPVYASDLESVITLTAQGRNIYNLTGIEYCLNLKVLHIYANVINDIIPLARLTSLRELRIYQNNITDISPIAKLFELEQLWLGRNNISDISPLRELTNMKVLVIINNNVIDISPLVENEGLSDGDTVNLTGNPLSTTSVDVCIPQLRARGVNIIFQ